MDTYKEQKEFELLTQIEAVKKNNAEVRKQMKKTVDLLNGGI